MTYRLFLDDERFTAAGDEDMTVVRSYDETVKHIERHGCPSFISFDHDLGSEKTGYDLAKWLVYRDLYSNGSFIPKDFSFYVHSQNPVGRENIARYLSRYLSLKNDPQGFEH